MVRRCIVPGCKYRHRVGIGKGHNDKTLYGFPKDYDRRVKWLKFIGLPPDVEIRTSWCICEVHFDVDQWEPRGDRRLKQFAIPNLTATDPENSSTGLLHSVFPSSLFVPVNITIEEASSFRPETMQPAKPPDGGDQSSEIDLAKEETSHDSFESLEDPKEVGTESTEPREAPSLEKSVEEITPASDANDDEQDTSMQKSEDIEETNQVQVDKDAEETIHTDNEKDAEETIHTDNEKDAEETIHTDNEKDAEEIVHTDKEKDAEEIMHTDNEKDAVEIVHTDNEKDAEESMHTDNEKDAEESMHTDNEKDAEKSVHTDNEKDAEESMHTDIEKDTEVTTQTNNETEVTVQKAAETNSKIGDQVMAQVHDDIEEQMTLIHSGQGAEEMIQIHDESFLQEKDGIGKETNTNLKSLLGPEGPNSEVDLTNVDLESQRLSGLCRVCAVSSSRLIPVFGNEKGITEKIHTFLPILVTPEDLLPVSICRKCLASLEQSQKLVQICLEADKKLKDLLESKLSGTEEVQLKSEREDVEEVDDYCGGCDDPGRPSTPFSPPMSTSPPPSLPVSPKREVISPEPSNVSSPKPKSKAAVTSTPKTSKKRTLRELARLETDMVTSKDPVGDARSPNILRRRTRHTTQDSLSPTILEKMRNYGIKDSSVVMTKVDIPKNTQSAVITTVSVPITKDKPKNRAGPKRLYRCLYCSETDSDAYKLLLHQMKMHPGNLLKCPHCGFVCGSDQKAKYDTHVLSHGLQDGAKREPEVIDLSSDQAEAPRPVNGPMLSIGIPQPFAVEPPPAPSGSGRQSKITAKPKSLLKAPQKRAVIRGPKSQKKGGLPALAPAPITSMLRQLPGNAFMLKIAVDGKAAGNGPQQTPTAIIPVTLYQCARCRLNFNTKEGVETHACVVKTPQPGLIPIAPKPGGLPLLVPIAPKPGSISYPCTTCGMIFDEAPLLREHMTTHVETFKCDICGSTFRTEFHLKSHAKKHNPEKNRFECPHCDKVYTVKSRLRVHVFSHSNEPRCVCPQCGKVFRTDGGFRNHLKAHENKRAFACSVCGLRFNRRGNMRRHERNCTGKKSLTCKYCSEKFDQHDDLLVHRANEHADLEMAEKMSRMANASPSGDKEKRYTCKVCNEGFVRVMDLRKHQVEKHTEDELAKTKDIPDGGAYLCDTCGKQIHHKHNYQLHMMHHQGKALFQCDQCDRTFTSKFALNYHHMLHTGDFPFKCSLCSESFRSSVALQVHRFKHTGEKPYRCKSCDMGFFTSHSLRLHQIVHSNERNYVCKVCGSTFKRSKTLRYHSLIHTGEKPYECRICGKAFRQKGTCTIHERNHAMANRKQKGGHRIISMELEADDNEQYEHLVEEETNIEYEDETAAQMVEMEVEEELEEAEVVAEEHQPQKQAQIWRITDPKVQYRVKNIDWKQATSSNVNEAVYILRESEALKEGLPEVCSVDTGGAVRLAEVAEGGLISMYPDMDIQDAEVVAGEKTIEFTTPDGTIRIIH